MFCILQKNGQYLWGADTKGKAQHPQVNSGSWVFTKDREIKLVPGPMSPMKETRYFAETSQGVFVFKSVEKEGRKTAVKNKELVLQLERVP